TNGPDAYRWSSNLRWSSVRVVERYQSYWPGPGGMTIHTSQVSPSLSCTIKQGSADSIQIFYDAGPGKTPVQAVGDMEQLAVSIQEDSAAFPENMQQATITADSSIYTFRLSWPQHKGL